MANPNGTPVHILKRDEGRPDSSWWTCTPDEWAARCAEAQARMARASNRLFKSHPDQEPRRETWQ